MLCKARHYIIRSCTVAACGGLFRPTITAFIVGHAISTAGKNTPTPGTGTRKRRVFACDHYCAQSSCFACHWAYQLWWRDLSLFCASRDRYNFAQVLHITVVVLSCFFFLIFCNVRSNTNIMWLFVVLVCPCGDMQVSPMVVAQL